MLENVWENENCHIFPITATRIQLTFVFIHFIMIMLADNRNEGFER